MLAVSCLPSWPANGDVLTPIVIARLGSSTPITGSGRGSSGSASVSPIVTSGMPATAISSPGPASSASTRSSASVTKSSVTFTRMIFPSARHQTTCWPLRIVPSRMRQSASRPRYGEASRLVTCACSGCPSSYDGAGNPLHQHVEERLEVVGELVRIETGAAGARVGVDDRELDLALVGVEIEEELVHLVHDLLDPRVRPVDLVDDEDHRQPRLERLAQHEPRLRQRPFARVDEQQHAVDHRQCALDLAAEVGVARRVDDVDLDPAAPDGRVLRQDRDPLLALEIHRVHHAVGDVLIRAKRTGLPQHRVDERRLAVIDVGDDRNVPDVLAKRHSKRVAAKRRRLCRFRRYPVT